MKGARGIKHFYATRKWDLLFLSVLLILSLTFFYKILVLPDSVLILGDHRHAITVESHIKYHLENISVHAPKIPILAILYLLNIIFSDTLAIKLFVVLILYLSLILIYISHKYFIRRIWRTLDEKLIDVSAFLGSLLFLFNPWTIDKAVVHYWLILSLSSSYLLLTEIDRTIMAQKISLRRSLFVALLLLFSATMPQSLIIYLGLMISLYFFCLHFNSSINSLKIFFQRNILAILIIFSINSIWLIPYFFSVLSGNGEVTAYGMVEENLETLSQRATFLHVFQGASRWIWEGYGWLSTPHYGITYLGINMWYIFALLPLMMVALSLFFIRSLDRISRKYIIFFSVLFILSISMSSGTQSEISGKLYKWIVFNSPLGWVFRDPYKNVGLFLISLSFLYASAFLFLNKTLANANRKHSLLLAIIFVSIAFSWGWPIITGDLNGYLDMGTVRYPNDLKEAIKLLESQKDINEYNTLWFPKGNVYYYYKDAPEISFIGNKISLQPPIEDYLAKNTNKNSNELDTFLKILSVKYIIIRNDVNPTYEKYVDDLNFTRDVLSKKYKRVYVSHDWEIFEVGSSNQIVHIAPCVSNVPSIDFSKIIKFNPCSTVEFIQPLFESIILSSDITELQLDKKQIITIKSKHHDPKNQWSLGSINGGWLKTITPYLNSLGIENNQYDYNKGLVFTWASDILRKNLDTNDLYPVSSWKFDSQDEVDEWKSYTPKNQFSSLNTVSFDKEDDALLGELYNSTWGWKTIKSPLIPVKYGDTYLFSFLVKAIHSQGVHFKIMEYDSLKQIIGTTYGENIGTGNFDWKKMDYSYHTKMSNASYMQLQIWHGHETKQPLPNKVWIDDVKVYDMTEYLEPVTLDMDVNVDHDGSYELFVRYFKNKDGGAIDIALDGKSIRKINTYDQLNKFVWDKVDTLELKKGKHKLTLTNVEGFNAVNIFALIPEKEYQEMEAKTESLLEGKRLMYIFEAESDLYRTDAPVSKKYGGEASNGEVLEFNQTSKAWQTVSIMRSDNYTMALKLNGDFNVMVDEINYNVISNNSVFAYVGPFYLEKGDHKIEITSKSNVADLDVVWLYSSNRVGETLDDVFTVNETPAIVSNYTKRNPTLYKVKVDAQKPFMLSFAESYDPLWYARIDKINGKAVKSDSIRPVPLYSVINGFWINQTGDLDITIEYEPQKWFYVGAIISITTLLACIGYLVYDWRKSKKPESKKSRTWHSEWKPVKGEHKPLTNIPTHYARQRAAGKLEDSVEYVSETARKIAEKIKDIITEQRRYNYRRSDTYKKIKKIIGG